MTERIRKLKDRLLNEDRHHGAPIVGRFDRVEAVRMIDNLYAELHMTRSEVVAKQFLIDQLNALYTEAASKLPPTTRRFDPN